jgi:hypothetical protein
MLRDFNARGAGWIETAVDESAGSKQQYVEDCQVCCQPNVLTVRRDGSAREFRLHRSWRVRFGRDAFGGALRPK